MRENWRNIEWSRGKSVIIIQKTLAKSGKMPFPGVSKKATLEHKNYTIIYEKFEERVKVKTTKILKKL